MPHPESFGYRFYQLRSNPWRHTDRRDTLRGTAYRPDPYHGDFLMVYPVAHGPHGRYYLVLWAECPGNVESLFHGEVTRLTDLTAAGYRRVPFDQVPIAWQQAFRAAIADAPADAS
jgi:hypothetical protein